MTVFRISQNMRLRDGRLQLGEGFIGRIIAEDNRTILRMSGPPCLFENVEVAACLHADDKSPIRLKDGFPEGFPLSGDLILPGEVAARRTEQRDREHQRPQTELKG